MEIRVKDDSIGLEKIETLSKFLMQEFDMVAEKPVRMNFFSNCWIVKFIQLDQHPSGNTIKKLQTTKER